MALRQYLQHVGVSLTQLLNAMLGGWPDESVSSRMWRKEMQGSERASLLRAAVDFLFFWQHDHCRHAYESERERQQLPPSLR